MTLTSTLPDDDRLEDLIETDDGSLVAVGSTGNAAGIARYLLDGEPDETFGENGLVVIGNKDQTAKKRVIARSAVSMPGGGVVVCLSWASHVRLVRLNPAGRILNSFGDGGYRRLQALSDCSDIARQGRSGVLVGGPTAAGSIVIKLSGNGRNDRTFGRNGVARGPSAGPRRAVAFAKGPGGSSFLVGPREIVKFRHDGRRDESFYRKGVLELDGRKGRPWSGDPIALSVDKDGSVYLVRRGGGGKISVFKRRSDGSRAHRYGFGGHLFVHSKAGRSFAADATVQDDGKLLIAGQLIQRCGTILNCERFTAVFRLSAGGRIDKTWRRGLASGRLGQSSSGSAVISEDGKVTLGGTAATSSGGNDFLLLRYNG